MTDAAAREQANTEAGTVEPGLRVPFTVDESVRDGRSRSRLARLVAAKLVLDLVFVCGLAAYTHAVTYRSGFDGALEQIDGSGARGWVVDLASPDADVEVQLFLNGEFVASTSAREAAADGRRSFAFEFRRTGEYEARVYAVSAGRGGERRTLQQLGGPRHFEWK